MLDCLGLKFSPMLSSRASSFGRILVSMVLTCPMDLSVNLGYIFLQLQLWQLFLMSIAFPADLIAGPCLSTKLPMVGPYTRLVLLLSRTNATRSLTLAPYLETTAARISHSPPTPIPISKSMLNLYLGTSLTVFGARV